MTTSEKDNQVNFKVEKKIPLHNILENVLRIRDIKTPKELDKRVKELESEK